VLCESCCVLVLPRPLYSLFPYTTLFRSRPDHGPGDLRSLVAQGMERVVSTPERFLDLAGSHRVRDSRPCRRHLGADAVKPGRDTLCLVEPLLQLIGAHVSQLWSQREGHERLAHGLFPSRDQRLRLVIRWKFVQESLQRGVVAVRHARPREDARPGVHLPANLCRDRALDLFLDPELTLPGRLERPVAMF